MRQSKYEMKGNLDCEELNLSAWNSKYQFCMT